MELSPALPAARRPQNSVLTVRLKWTFTTQYNTKLNAKFTVCSMFRKERNTLKVAEWWE